MLELFIETVEVLDTPVYPCLEPKTSHFIPQNATNTLDVGAPLFALHLYLFAHPGIFIWLKNFKGEIFQFAFDTRHAKSPGQRGINLPRLLCHHEPFLRFRWYLTSFNHTHGMEPISK